VASSKVWLRSLDVEEAGAKNALKHLKTGASKRLWEFLEQK